MSMHMQEGEDTPGEGCPPPPREGSEQDADLCKHLLPFLLLHLRKFHQDISHRLDCFFEIFSAFALLFSTLCHLFLLFYPHFIH